MLWNIFYQMIYHITLNINNFFDKVHNNYKDNIPAIRDWNNSVYFYNKDNIKNTVSNDNVANNIISNYFNLNIFLKRFAFKSKRMRNLRRKLTIRQLYNSKSFIKQTINKCIVTIFTFDRESKKYNNYLYFIQKKMITILQKLYKLAESNNIIKKPKFSKIHNNFNTKISMKNKLRHLPTLKTNKINTKYASLYKKYDKKRLNNYKFNVINSNKLLLHNIYSKRRYIRQVVLWNYYNWLLGLFNLHIKTEHKVTRNTFKNMGKGKRKLINKGKNKLAIIMSIYSIQNNRKLYLNKNNINILKKFVIKSSSLEQLNIKVKNFIKYNLYTKLPKLFIEKTYKWYCKKNYKRLIKRLIKRYLRKERNTLRIFSKLRTNRLKKNNLIIGLKMILSNIYNKNIEVNIVNLKHPQLNSDILMKALSIKLKRRKSMMKLVMDKCLNLIKIPQKIHVDNINNGIYFKQINNLKSMNINNVSSSNRTNKDRLNKILTSLFSNFRKSKEILLNKTLLSNLKYKWVTGIKLQAAGRLSKRFVAARSMYKFIYKGNIRNMEYKDISLNDSKKKSILINKSVNNVRNTLKSNIEYTLVSSKKRIGAFGVKGWINNN